MKYRRRVSLVLSTNLVIMLALLVYSFAGTAATAPERTQVVVLSTTDLHGNIYPIDYYTNKPDTRGLAKIATAVKQARESNPNLLLLDSGDTIQGTPLAYFHNKKNNAPPDPMMLTMSALKYDAMAVGNHEYNFGLKNLEKARREASFPWISSNTYKAGTNETYYQPYIIKEVGGVRVGVLGLTTPGIPNWENPQNYSGLEFRETVGEAKKWVPILRGKERVDLVVISMHMGVEEDLRTGELNPSSMPNENAAVRIAREVPGIDLILMGHTHREVPSLFVNGVLLIQANHWGRHLARADIYLEKQEGGEGRWRVVAKSGRTIAMDERIKPDEEILALAKPYDAETQSWLGRVIGESSAELTATNARFQDSAILDLIQRVQLEAGKADVSMSAVFNQQARIPKGPVTVRDIAGLYVYENTLVTLEVTGRQLKEALEHSARYFLPYVAGKRPSELVNSQIPSYNFDMAEGVTYDLDITRPPGDRIQNLRLKGKEIAPGQKLRLVTNNYRVNGGGGYTMYKNAPVIYKSSEEIRELIIDWVERNKIIPPEPTGNWRLLPPEEGAQK